jgi:dipeptidyl aminopeptidase/acylaminoacyl peptidase
LIYVQVPTRDGRKLINFLTLPQSFATIASATEQKKFLPPLIAYIHGGPSTRDFLQFDPWVTIFLKNLFHG